MPSRRQSVILGLLGWICLTAVSPATALSPDPIIYELDAVERRLLGRMETLPHPERPQVRMTTCQVEPSGFGAYLYQEQALVENLEQPYRQRLLLITVDPEGLNGQRQVVSRSFKLLDPTAWVGACDRPVTERPDLDSSLGEAVCSIFFEWEERANVGTTPPEGCPTQFRGAVRITNTVILNDQGMDTWDRGFDAEGNQVWGAAEGKPYQFRRRILPD
ncbi:MAG: chromophore lyase CpcT/CpeT [Cyanobacteria bacterium P01_G01_bin.54]